MVEFETIEKHETEYGANNFIEVARKVARDDNGSTEFIALTRGYLDSQGSRRYKTNLTLPTDPEILGFVKDALGKL